MADVQQSESHSEIASLSPLAQLQFVSTTVLQQALDLVENILTSDEQLTIQSKFLPGSTIGILTLYDPYLLLRDHTRKAFAARTRSLHSPYRLLVRTHSTYPFL
jgi:hypothetical protein